MSEASEASGAGASGGAEFGAKIRALLADQLGVDIDELRAEASILDDLGADSLDVVEMVMALEEEFDIEVPDEAAEAMKTVGDVEAYVTRRLTGGS